MNEKEFRIALDTSLTKDRISLCLEYISDIQARSCSNCNHSIETDDGGYDFYCNKLNDYMYACQSCTHWEILNEI